MNTLYAAALTSEILNLQRTISQVTGQTATDILQSDLRKLLREYATADFVIFRCECEASALPIKSAPRVKRYCGYCGKNIERLLADGTWQANRKSKQYRKESGK